MSTNREEMIARVRACIAQGTNPNGDDTLAIVAADDPEQEGLETLVSLYMYRLLCARRDGRFNDVFFPLLKKAYQAEEFGMVTRMDVGEAYEESWDGETGDLDQLHALVDAFSHKQLAYVGI